MKMLYILNVANRVNNFCMSSLLAAKDLDIEYHIAGNWGYKNTKQRIADEKKYGIHIHQIDFIRSPFNFKNYKAYKQLNNLMEKERFDVVHCNTPIGGLLGRLIAKKLKVKNVYYQAHGFHFYKGAPKLNWLLFYPVEKWLAHYTDVLITINQEDYELAKKKLKVKRIEYVPGVGIDIDKIFSYKLSENEKNEFCNELGISPTEKILVSVGELNDNKNHQVVLKSLPLLKNQNVHYVIAGKGNRDDYLLTLAKELGVSDRFHLLGFRDDIIKIYKCADVCCFPSIREGLGIAALEGMAAGLPLVASYNRGTRDYCKNGINGFMCDPYTPQDFAKAIDEILDNSELYSTMSTNNLKDVENFSISTVNKSLFEIYSNIG